MWPTHGRKSHNGSRTTTNSIIIYLTKVKRWPIIVLYGHKPHVFLGLAADRVACSCLRMSFFIDASSLRVGTRFRASFLSSLIRYLPSLLPQASRQHGDSRCLWGMFSACR